MTEQRLLALKGWNLGWYFGTDCEKCCGVYPRAMHRHTNSAQDFYYKCDVCGKKTAAFTRPFMAKDAWNNHEYQADSVQLSFL